jgi:hypothetical protein
MSKDGILMTMGLPQGQQFTFIKLTDKMKALRPSVSTHSSHLPRQRPVFFESKCARRIDLVPKSFAVRKLHPELFP